jgi:hypothetical protein
VDTERKWLSLEHPGVKVPEGLQPAEDGPKGFQARGDGETPKLQILAGCATRESSAALMSF